VRCRDCGHEYLLAYSCKRRYFCTSCHTKRAVVFAEWLHTTVLWPVAHRQVVLTIPKMLRAYFRYDRRLLGDLCRVAADVLVKSFRALLGKSSAEPGLVVCVHSFGNLLNFHPHLHVMATDGGFTPEGVFHPLPAMSLAPLEQLYRHSVFKMLLRKGLLTPERIKLMKSWEHSGFNVNAAVRIGADDTIGRENLARYLIRAPFSMNKIRYDPAATTVIYKTKMVEGPNRNFEIFDPLDFLAAVTSHIPNRGEHLVRYYGYYSSVQRGRRRRQGREKMPLGPVLLSDDAPHASWARFIKKVFAVDPLVCPDCGGAMRIMAFIEDRRVVRAILEHLSLWDEPRPPPAPPAAPRAPLELEYLPWVERSVPGGVTTYAPAWNTLIVLSDMSESSLSQSKSGREAPSRHLRFRPCPKFPQVGRPNVIWSAEWDSDPGDEKILQRAHLASAQASRVRSAQKCLRGTVRNSRKARSSRQGCHA